MTLPTPSQYWLTPGSITLTPNAEGNANLMQVQTPADACLLAYMPNVPELDYDVNHNFRKWYIKSSNVCFNTDTPKYVYLRIPRTQAAIDADPEAVDSTGKHLSAPADQYNAELCYPSDHIDIYGCTHTNEFSSDDVVKQFGTRQYIYIFLQGIISANNGNSRSIQQSINYGSLSAHIFIQRKGACSFQTRDFPGLTDYWLQAVFDGNMIIFDMSLVPEGKTYVSLWIPSPKFHEGETYEVRIISKVSILKGGLHIWTSDPDYALTYEGRGDYKEKTDFFFIQRDADDSTTSGDFYPCMLQVYGRCSFTITSVRGAHNTGDPLNDWMWAIGNINIHYLYNRGSETVPNWVKCMWGTGFISENHPNKDTTVQYSKVITKEGWRH